MTEYDGTTAAAVEKKIAERDVNDQLFWGKSGKKGEIIKGNAMEKHSKFMEKVKKRQGKVQTLKKVRPEDDRFTPVCTIRNIKQEYEMFGVTTNSSLSQKRASTMYNR